MKTTGIDVDYPVHPQNRHSGWSSIGRAPEAKPRLPLIIQKFKVVTSSDHFKLEAEVNFCLAEGWQLYGNIAVVAGPSHGHFIYTQSLVKDEIMVEN